MLINIFLNIKHSKHHVYDKDNCCSNNQIIVYKVPLLLRGKEEAPFYTIKELRLM
jgi:hypothetical protein